MPAGTSRRPIALVTMVLLVGAGLCLFDAGHTDDLCLPLVATPVGLLLAFPLTATDHLLPLPAKAYHRYPPDLPAPPPKA